MGSLFAGIGGFDLGFERASTTCLICEGHGIYFGKTCPRCKGDGKFGFKTVWQVEIDPYCRKVLERHFPHAERFNDIRECGVHNLKPVDVITGGFPCQDVSQANTNAEGLDGVRSGLWSQYARIVSEIRPRFIVVENVAALLGRGLGRVLGDLSEIGYDAEWRIIPASFVGLNHRRERIWIVAHPHGKRPQRGKFWVSENSRKGNIHAPILSSLPLCQESPTNHLPEPYVIGSDDGIPSRAHRIRALGNAVVPQIPELIAHQILAELEREEA